jgi:hypothetical protein
MKTILIFIIIVFISFTSYSQEVSISTKKNVQTVSKIDTSIVITKRKTIGILFNPIKNQQSIINKIDIKQEDVIIKPNITTNKNENKPK